MSERLLVAAPARLLDFLRQQLGGWRRKTLEQRLAAGCIRVNGVTVSRREYALAPGDLVLVLSQADGTGLSKAAPAFVTLYADEDLIAIDKPVGLLSVATDQGSERNALALVRDSLTQPGKKTQLWPAHRLDREASGVLLFAKSRAARAALQQAWPEARKVYLAVVAGRPQPESGLIDQPLFEDRDLYVRAGPHPHAKPARTRYSTLRSLRSRSLLQIELDSGRRHQIRAHLAWLGHPIVGDPRYGQSAPRMGLHAQELEVAHPSSGQRLHIEAPVPGALLALLTERVGGGQ